MARSSREPVFISQVHDDSTERPEVEAKHRKIDKHLIGPKETEQRGQSYFKAVLVNSIDVLYQYNFKTQQYDYISDSIESLTGDTPQQVMDAGVDYLLNSLHPDDEPAFMKVYLGLLNNTITEPTIHLEYRTRHKDGRYRWRSDIITVIRDDNNVIEAVAGTARDVTTQKQAEEELKASQERYKRLSEAAFNGVLVHDKGIIIDANPRFLKMYACSMDQIRGMDCFRLIAPQSHDLVRQKIAEGSQGPYEAFGMTMDGIAFPVEVRARELNWNGKKVRIATFLDLTEQKRLQQQFTESENKYRKLYNNAAVALFRTSLNGMLLDCNKACLRFFGHSEDEEEDNYLNKICVIGYYVDPNRRTEFIEALKNNKCVNNFEAELKRADGTNFWASFSAKIFSDHGYIEGSMRDITAKKILTQTEKKILALLMEGKSNKQIARQLNRSIRTIEDHRSHIMHKFGVDNAFELAEMAHKMGFIPPE